MDEFPHDILLFGVRTGEETDLKGAMGRGLCGLRDGAGVFDGMRERGFAIYKLAACERGQDAFLVEKRRRRHENGLDVFLFKELFVILIGLGGGSDWGLSFASFFDSSQEGLVGIANRHDWGIWQGGGQLLIGIYEHGKRLDDF